MMDSIEMAIADIKKGKVVIVVDDEKRENEGDFITAAANVTPQLVNFLTREGRGLLCAPIAETIADRLELPYMVSKNTALHQTPFTVSVDLLGHNCTTGISAFDRSATIKALINPETRPDDLGRPGHIFPLRAQKWGVLQRTGHTEAAVDLAKLAGFEPAGVLVEIMDEDGKMARRPRLQKIAEKFDVKIIAIKDLITYKLKSETLIEEVVRVDMPTKFGHFKLVAFRRKDKKVEYLALVMGEWVAEEPVKTYIFSGCYSSDVLENVCSDGKEYLHTAMADIQRAGKGVIILYGEDRSFEAQLKKYQSADEGDTPTFSFMMPNSNEDISNIGIISQILHHIGIDKIMLGNNFDNKVLNNLQDYNIKIMASKSCKIHRPAMA